jgi:hypothetical protein
MHSGSHSALEISFLVVRRPRHSLLLSRNPSIAGSAERPARGTATRAGISVPPRLRIGDILPSRDVTRPKTPAPPVPSASPNPRPRRPQRDEASDQYGPGSRPCGSYSGMNTHPPGVTAQDRAPSTRRSSHRETRHAYRAGQRPSRCQTVHRSVIAPCILQISRQFESHCIVLQEWIRQFSQHQRKAAASPAILPLRRSGKV